MTGLPPYDVAIVGAGMAGAAIAYHLPASMRVALLEQESRPGYHATGRSAAMYMPSYGGELAQKLALLSRPFFEAPPLSVTEYALLAPRGFLCFARPGEEAELLALHRQVRNLVPSVTLEDAAGAVARVPVLRPESVAAALYYAEAYDLDVAELHHGFLRSAKAGGNLTILNEARVEACAFAGSKWQLRTSLGNVEAGLLVNAAGAWADELAKMSGVSPLGMRPLRRSAALIPAPEGVEVGSWPMVLDVGETFYFKPDAGKLLVSPADEDPSDPIDAWADDLVLAEGIDRFTRATTVEVKRVDASWAGLRTFAPDRQPVIGFDPECPAFFWSVGQGGAGVQTAPAWGALAACMISGESGPATGLRASDVQALSPARFRR